MFCVKQFRVWITQKVELSFHIAFRTIYSGKLSRETTSQRPQTQFTLKFMGDFVPYFCGSRCQLWVNLILSVAKLRPHTLLIISFTCCFPSAIHHLFTVAVSDKLISKCLKKKFTIRKVFILTRNKLGLEKQDKMWSKASPIVQNFCF